jgi:hypothetical protein
MRKETQMTDVQIILDAVLWPTVAMVAALGVGFAILLRLRPSRGY